MRQQRDLSQQVGELQQSLNFFRQNLWALQQENARLRGELAVAGTRPATGTVTTQAGVGHGEVVGLMVGDGGQAERWLADDADQRRLIDGARSLYSELMEAQEPAALHKELYGSWWLRGVAEGSADERQVDMTLYRFGRVETVLPLVAERAWKRAPQ